METVVFKETGPDWERFERAVEARGVPLPLQARASWVRALGEASWLVGLRDEQGVALWGCAVSVSRSRALPRARILRAPRFGHGLPPGIMDAACAALRDLARAEKVLRLHAELYVPEASLRASVLDALMRAGFARTLRSRSYDRTVLIGLRPAEDELFASLHGTCRRHIRAAGKHGLDCRAIEDPALAGRMTSLVAETMGRTGGPRLAENWAAWIEFAAARPELARVVGVFKRDASGPEALRGFVLGCRHGDTVEYRVAASTRPVGSSVPLLYAPTWELIRWARSVGATTFDFGGIASGTAGPGDARSGISDFKRYFSRNEVEVGGEGVFEPSRWRAAAAAAVSRAVAFVRRRPH